MVIACHFAQGLVCDELDECAWLTTSQSIADKLECSAFASCAFSTFTLTCIADECDIECVEDDACLVTTATMASAKQVKCEGHQACWYATFTLPDVADGFELHCDGTESCGYMIASMTGNVEKITCDGAHACYGANFTVEVADDFEIECKHGNACQESTMALTVSADTELDGIDCEGPQACLMTTINIQGTAGESVVIDELKCEGHQSCLGLSINAIDADVTIKKCICGDSSPYNCLCATGLDVCQELQGLWATTAAGTVWEGYLC